MQRPKPSLEAIATLPIAELPEGEIGPPLDPDHPTWDVLGDWMDPLASRGGYRRPSLKQRIEVEGMPAIEWAPARPSEHDRSLVTGHPEWQDYTVSCRAQQLQGYGSHHQDDPTNREARTGLVFRMATVRRYYFFGLESQQRLILYRRIDDEWCELATADVTPGDRVVTLTARVCGGGIHAECPELGVTLDATDSLIPAGLAGFRALGRCRLFDLSLSMSPGEKGRNEARVRQLHTRTARLGETVSDPEEVAVIEIPEDSGLVQCTDFCERGRNDLLFHGPQGLLARTWDGQELWRCAGAMSAQNAVHTVFSEDFVGEGRLLYALLGERSSEESIGVTGKVGTRMVSDEIAVIDAHTGKVLNRRRLPEADDSVPLLNFDFSYETGALRGDRSMDIVVREWRKDCGGGGRRLWAYDSDLNDLWYAEVDPPYGHHNAVHFFDVDGDGRPELLAGGTLLSADGETIWRHDRADEMVALPHAGHYDACVVGFFAGDADLDPTAFLAGGSAGLYVADALTGKTRSVHRVGHAQWAMSCNVRPDRAGTEVLVGTRWGNYGILTLFSGRGKRLWSVQPDYVLQGSRPVQWASEGPQHIWLNTSRAAFGLYDGWGRLVKPLNAMRELYAPITKAPCTVLRPQPDATDHLAIRSDRGLHVFRAQS